MNTGRRDHARDRAEDLVEHLIKIQCDLLYCKATLSDFETAREHVVRLVAVGMRSADDPDDESMQRIYSEQLHQFMDDVVGRLDGEDTG